MRSGALWLWPMLAMALSACGPEFSAATAGLDAAIGSNEASADGNDFDGARADATVPPVADGLALWLRGDLGVTVSDGGVAAWEDLSGNHLDARQTDSTRRPSLATMSPSGRTALAFEGQDFLDLPSGFADFSRGVSLFAVATFGVDAAPCADFVHFSNGAEIDDIALGRHNGRAQYEVLEGVLTGSDFAAARARVISAIHGVDGDASMRLDGGQKSSSTFELPRPATRISNVIGRSLYAGCGSVHGALAEVLVYQRALDDAERIRVETELQTRWIR
jgi:hypothetical protein